MLTCMPVLLYHFSIVLLQGRECHIGLPVSVMVDIITFEHLEVGVVVKPHV